MKKEKKGQFDFDEINIAGIIFAVIAFGIGVIVSKSAGSTLMWRLMAGVVCGLVAYFVGSKIVES